MALDNTLQGWIEGPPPERDDGGLAIVELAFGVQVDGQDHHGHPIIVSRWSAKLKTTGGAHRLNYVDVLRYIDIAHDPAAMRSSPPSHCKICKRLLNDPGDPVGSKDCGGDCCRCMASCGDVDCYMALHAVEPDKYPLDEQGEVP